MKTTKTTSTGLWPLINLVAFLATVAVNAAAQLVPLGGATTGEISARYQGLLTPAGYTFSIWGVIYLLLAFVMIYQLLPRHRDFGAKIGPLFAASCLLNIGWILTWHYDLFLPALAMILLLLVTLALLANRARKEHWLVQTTMSVYYGWITVAAGAAVFVTVTRLNPAVYDSGFMQLLALFTLALVSAVVFFRARWYKDMAYLLAVAWAGFGILAAHLSRGGFNGRFPAIVIALIAMEIFVHVVLIDTIIRVWKTRGRLVGAEA